MTSSKMWKGMFLCTLAAMLNWPGVSGTCNVRTIDRRRCIFKWECMDDLINATIPKYCESNPVIDLQIRTVSPDGLNEFLNNSLIKYITKIDARFSSWMHLPLHFLQETSNLQKLVLYKNKLSVLYSKSFYYNQNLTLIDLSFNEITTIRENAFKFDEDYNKLQELLLSYNLLTVIDDDLFSNLKSLKKLDLSHNQIRKLGEFAFRGLDSLEILQLNSNNLLVLNLALRSLTNLKHLYLRDNHFHHLDIDEIPHAGEDLITFDISENVLSYVNPDLFKRQVKLNQVKKQPRQFNILLAGNKLISIENASFNDVDLSDADIRTHFHSIEMTNTSTPTAIDLSNNIIQKVEYNAFQGVKKLIILDLSTNKLTYFLVNTNNLADLKHLDLRNNQMHQIFSEFFSKLGKVTTLDLTNNSINYIPKYSFNDIKYLTSLNLSENNITEIGFDSLGDLDFMRVLDLSNNDFQTVKLSALRNPELSVLNLRMNAIEDMGSVELDNFAYLKYFDLSYNKIKKLDQNAFKNINTIQTLDLSHNNISEIKPSAFFTLKVLEYLNLKNNRISKLEYGIFHGLGHLQQLDLSFNKITHLESKIFYELSTMKTLKLDNNEISFMNLDMFRTRTGPLVVSIGGNRLSCEVLTSFVNEANHGWLQVNLTAMTEVSHINNVNGIECQEEQFERIQMEPCQSGCKEDLLISNLEIKKAVEKQTDTFEKEMKIIEKLLITSNRIAWNNKRLLK